MTHHELRAIDSFGAFFSKRKAAFENNTCICCNNPAHEFRDELSEKEWKLSALCQDCQDSVFGKSEDDAEWDPSEEE